MELSLCLSKKQNIKEMELNKTPPEKIAKNLWNTLKLIFYIMKKSIGKSKLIVLDLNTLLKRGKIASKALTKLLILHHHHNYYSALTCRSQDDVVVHKSFISPREYEFSCRDTPLFPGSKRKKYLHKINKEEEEAKLMQKVLNILHRYDVVEATPESSPMLPGFGWSPVGRQLRVSDSPFLSKDADNDEKMVNGNYQVDRDAEAFINKFYKDLKNQKSVAAGTLDSPSPYHIWAR